jgi:tetratricopeptide (TPR) repeat protein
MPRNTDTEKRFSVCMGINTYAPEARLAPLDYAENDARSMDEMLGKLGFAPENRTLLLGKEATAKAVNTALETMIFDRAKENDLIVFYYAGHGEPIRIGDRTKNWQNEVFLTPYDFDEQEIKSKPSFRLQHALGMKRLRNTFFESQEGSRKRLFIFDSCHSGYFYGSNYRNASSQIQSSIKNMLDCDSLGRVFLASCLPYQTAAESLLYGHGLLTYHVLLALSGKVPEARRPNGTVTVGSLFDYLADILPPDQRPVKGGVEQDTFVLVHYPELAITGSPGIHNGKEPGKEARLQAMWTDNRGFLQDRLASFVGREKELVEVRQHIKKLLPTGGYLTITGEAGQGKSSIIAKLVEDTAREQGGFERLAFHFIPLTPPPDYQVALLRNLMSRLILKYDLSDLYLASESRAALGEGFPRVLKEVAAKGGQEIVYIDGLDQLQADQQSGLRDLSFLPQGPGNPPHGIVFVLGTRPNDTLRPLELRKPYYEYKLRNLSRPDFDRILQHRGVALEPSLADIFYRALNKNALFLDLVAKELAERKSITNPEIEKIVREIANDPEHVFSLTIDRLRQQGILWQSVIKPLLGLLLVTSEPLLPEHLKHLLNLDSLVKIDGEYLNQALERLGGLVVVDNQYRYSLFHLKFRDYLRQDRRFQDTRYIVDAEAEQHWHKCFVAWCEAGDVTHIWKDHPSDRIEQDRRRYARQHYITHLYFAEEWDKLFHVLDTGLYGKAKTQKDPSRHSYALDLDLGRKAAASDLWDLEEAIHHLPYLWRYTLLRCSLASRADSYSKEAFALLLLLGQEAKVLGLAELLTDVAYRAQIFALLAHALFMQSGREHEARQLFVRAEQAILSIPSQNTREDALADLASVLVEVQLWEEVERIIAAFSQEKRANALSTFSQAFVQAGRWHEAEAMSQTLSDNHHKATVLIALGTACAQVQLFTEATHFWQEAERAIRQISDDWQRHDLFDSLGIAFAQAQRWQEAERLIQVLPERQQQSILAVLAQARVRARHWAEAEQIISTISDIEFKAMAFDALFTALLEAQLWSEAKRLMLSSPGWDDVHEQIKLSTALTHAGRWQEAKQIISALPSNERKAQLYITLGTVLLNAQQWKKAEQYWQEAENILNTFSNEKREREEGLLALGTAFAQAKLWRRAEQVISTLSDEANKMQLQIALSNAFVQAERWEDAIHAVLAIPVENGRGQQMIALATTFVQKQQRVEAERCWQEAERLILTQPNKTNYRQAITDLGTALTLAHRWEEAEQVMLGVLNDADRIDTLITLGTIVDHAQHQEKAMHYWEEAKQHILVLPSEETVGSRSRGVPIAFFQAEYLTELGTAMWNAEQAQEAEHCWREAEHLLITMAGQWSKGFTTLGTALIQAQRWRDAERVFLSNSNKSGQVEGLFALITALVKEQDWGGAGRVTLSIPDEKSKIQAFIALGTALALAQHESEADHHWQEAEHLASQLPYITDRAEIFTALGAAFARVQHWSETERCWQEAEQIIQTLPESWNKNKALIALVRVFAQAQRWEEAERLLLTFPRTVSRDEALALLSTAYAQAQRWEEAEHLTSIMSNIQKKAEALAALSIAHARAQHWEYAEYLISTLAPDMEQNRHQALNGLVAALAQQRKHSAVVSIIQKEWIQTTSKDHALRFFSLAYTLIPFYPELGMGLYKAFAWVDDFLQW